MNSKSIRAAVLAVFFLSTSVMFIAAQGHAMNMKEHQLTKHEVKALIVGAKTAEDHMKLALYFRGEAQRQEASAKYHDEMAELYKANRMPIKVLIPTPFRPYGKQSSVEVAAQTVGEALNSLVTLHPDLRKHLFAEDGKLRSFVNVYLNDEDIRYLAKDATAAETDTITIVPSVAGGV